MKKSKLDEQISEITEAPALPVEAAEELAPTIAEVKPLRRGAAIRAERRAAEAGEQL